MSVVQSAGAFQGGGNLPAEVTSFVGRHRELADVKCALAKSRLVTLTGVGGVGIVDRHDERVKLMCITPKGADTCCAYVSAAKPIVFMVL